MGTFNGGGFKPLMNLSSHYLTLKTVSEKVHRGGVRHTDKPAVRAVSLDIGLSEGEGLGGFGVSAESAGGGRGEEVGGGLETTIFPQKRW